MNISKVSFRSAPAQLLLLAVVFLCAVALASAGLVLGMRFLEPTVREKHPPLADAAREAVADLLAGRLAADRFPVVDRKALYGALIDDPEFHPPNPAATHLISVDGAVILERIKKTLVLGSSSQRLQAIHLLSHVEAEELRPKGILLARYAAARGRRRSESTLASAAEELLQRWGERDFPLTPLTLPNTGDVP